MTRFTANPAASRARSALIAAGLMTALSTPVAALAQDQQPGTAPTAPEPTIIVQGERELDTRELRDAIRDVAMRGRDAKTPMPRYQTPLCPQVLGMGERMGAYVTERVRQNTIDAGFTLADKGCTANALLIVVDDQETLIKRMKQNHPGLFNPRISREIRAAQNRGDGAIVWSTYAMQGPNGRDGAASGTVFSNTLETAFANAGGAATEMRLAFPSQLRVAYSLEKMTTIMVIDVDRLDGVNLDQLSDFATMRILGHAQPTIDIAQEGAVSILNLFDGAPTEAPRTMTALDRAYLKGLYAMRPNDPATRLEHFVKLAYQNGGEAKPGEPAEPATGAR